MSWSIWENSAPIGFTHMLLDHVADLPSRFPQADLAIVKGIAALPNAVVEYLAHVHELTLFEAREELSCWLSTKAIQAEDAAQTDHRIAGE